MILLKTINTLIIKNKNEQNCKELFSLVKKEGIRNGEIKSLKIYELAQNSITTRAANNFIYIALENCIKILRETEEYSNSILTQMQIITYTLLEYKIVTELKGIGDKLASRLIVEIGDVRIFTSTKALNVYV